MSLVARMLKPGLPALGLLLVAGLPSTAEAGAWMRSEGTLQMGASVGLTTSDKRWNEDRRRESADCRTHRQSMSVSAEYGYSYYHTLFADAGITNRDCSNEPNVSGLSDLTVGVRGRLNPFRNGRSWELALKLPISGTSADPDRPGKGEFGLEAGVHFSLYPDPYEVFKYRDGVWSWGAGVRLWTGGLAHQGWAYGGWSHPIDDDWSFSARLSGVMSFAGRRSADGSISNDYDKLSASIGVRRSISPTVSMSLGLSHDVRGRESDQGTSIRLGFSREWR